MLNLNFLNLQKHFLFPKKKLMNKEKNILNVIKYKKIKIFNLIINPYDLYFEIFDYFTFNYKFLNKNLE
jgi:hypothetical protein